MSVYIFTAGSTAPSVSLFKRGVKSHLPSAGIIRNSPYSPVGRVAQSVQRLTTGWTVRDRISVGTRFSALQTVPGAHPASYTMGTGSLPGVEGAGAWG